MKEVVWTVDTLPEFILLAGLFGVLIMGLAFVLFVVGPNLLKSKC